MAHETLLCTGTGSEKWERLTDNHVIALQIYLQRNGLEYISKDSTHDAIDACARCNSFHPVRKYLESLTWDGVERLPTWLSRYLGVKQTEYTKAVGTMFMISAIARIMKPGCQADYTLVFEGPQGELKSSVCRTLAGDAHFLDHLPALKNKDSSQILRGKWFVECAEMRAFSEAKISETKEFITRRTEIYFARYGRVESKEPRQCVIIISTNESIYLYDPSGNRRYWPVKIGTIDLEALKRDRDQLWAEAKARYNKGEHWWPDREFERQYILPEQEARYQEDPWTEEIAGYLDRPQRVSILDGGKPNQKEGPPPDRITIGELAWHALHLEAKDMDRKKSDRIARILITLGWTRGPKVKGQQRWLRPQPPGDGGGRQG
jgi:predicted P-loop ATPase